MNTKVSLQIYYKKYLLKIKVQNKKNKIIDL